MDINSKYPLENALFIHYTNCEFEGYESHGGYKNEATCKEEKKSVGEGENGFSHCFSHDPGHQFFGVLAVCKL